MARGKSVARLRGERKVEIALGSDSDTMPGVMDQQPSPGSDPIPPIPPLPPSDIPPPPPTPGPEGAASGGVGGEVPPPPPQSPPGFGFSTTPPPAPIGLPPANSDERLWAMLIHISGIIGSLSWTHGIPGGNVLLPLILWLIKRDGAPFVDDQGKEALNFQITLTIAGLVLTVTCVGLLLLPVLGLYSLVVSIIAAIKANDGVPFRYPLIVRFVK